jgi:hypothetical protein
MSVKDTGPGIPEEEIPIVLASFGQGSNAIKTAEGAGLGLPIAKSFTDLHGGTFTLKSKLRVGTEIIVAFPPQRVMAAHSPIADHESHIQPQAPAEPSSLSFDGVAFRAKRVRSERLKSSRLGVCCRACLERACQQLRNCVLLSCVYGA